MSHFVTFYYFQKTPCQAIANNIYFEIFQNFFLDGTVTTNQVRQGVSELQFFFLHSHLRVAHAQKIKKKIFIN